MWLFFYITNKDDFILFIFYTHAEIIFIYVCQL